MGVVCDTQAHESIIRVSGFFDCNVAHDFQRIAREIPAGNLVCVDLKEARMIDSAGLGSLLLLCDVVYEGYRIRILNANDDIKRVMFLARYETLFDIL